MTGTLILHSGGIDSLVPLYLLLRDTDDPVMALYVHRKNLPFARGEVERYWTERQWAWLKTNIRDFETRVIEAEVPEFQETIYHEFILGKAGEVLASDQDYTKVMSGRCAEDATSPTANWEGLAFTAAAGVPYATARQLSPVRDLTKAQLAASLPGDLLRLVWGCQNPVEDPQQLGPEHRIQCRQCTACKHYQQAGIYADVYWIEPPPTPNGPMPAEGVDWAANRPPL